MILACTQWPKPSSPTLLLLHGMGGTGALWRPLAVSLEDHWNVLAPDQRGHGRSRPAEGDFTPLSYGQDIVQTLESLKSGAVWALGHSMGVRSAVAAAYLKPELFRGLILVDLGFSGLAGGGLGEDLAKFVAVLPQHFESRALARTYMNEQCPDPAIAQYLMAVSQVAPSGELSFPFDQGALIQTIQAARDSSVQAWALALAARGMPILALRGGSSRVWHPTLYEKERDLFRDYPQVVFETIEGATHGLPFEKRQWLAERINRFALGAEGP